MRTWLACCLLLLLATPAAAQDWRRLDPENTLVIDTTKGRMIVEMRPELAPKAVERVKLLARERVYDGLQFHRVIEGFVAQTGNPNNKDGGVSRHPDLEPEFTFKLPPVPSEPCRPEELIGPVQCIRTADFRFTFPVVRGGQDTTDGLVGSVPVAGEISRGLYRGWGVYCAGVAGMGRQADPGSANSELFFMFAPERRLDHDYTVWGRIVAGRDVLNRLAVGEPPASADLMRRVLVASDLTLAERPQVMVESGRALRRRIDAARAERGADFSVCDVEIVTREGG